MRREIEFCNIGKNDISSIINFIIFYRTGNIVVVWNVIYIFKLKNPIATKIYKHMQSLVQKFFYSIPKLLHY